MSSEASLPPYGCFHKLCAASRFLLPLSPNCLTLSPGTCLLSLQSLVFLRKPMKSYDFESPAFENIRFCHPGLGKHQVKPTFGCGGYRKHHVKSSFGFSRARRHNVKSSFVRFASLGAAFADSLVRIVIFCFWDRSFC